MLCRVCTTCYQVESEKKSTDVNEKNEQAKCKVVHTTNGSKEAMPPMIGHTYFRKVFDSMAPPEPPAVEHAIFSHG